MTFDALTIATVTIAVLGALGGITSWVFHTVVLSRIAGLEKSRDGMGARFGEGLSVLDKKLDNHVAYEQGRRDVIRERRRRRP